MLKYQPSWCSSKEMKTAGLPLFHPVAYLLWIKQQGEVRSTQDSGWQNKSLYVEEDLEQQGIIDKDTTRMIVGKKAQKIGFEEKEDSIWRMGQCTVWYVGYQHGKKSKPFRFWTFKAITLGEIFNKVIGKLNKLTFHHHKLHRGDKEAKIWPPYIAGMPFMHIWD